MTPEEQLDKWVEGNPVHNDERDECCPDFSCCVGMLAPKEVRLRFAKAFREKDQKTMDEMLMMFLGELLGGANAHIAGSDANYKMVN